MLKIECHGCARSVRADASEGLMFPTKVTIETWSASGPHEADLCIRCLERLLAGFFNVTPSGLTDEQRERDGLLGPPSMPRYLEEADAVGSLA